MAECENSTDQQKTQSKAVRGDRSQEPDDRVRSVLRGGELPAIKTRPLGRLFGVLRHGGAPVILEDMERAIIEGACDT